MDRRISEMLGEEKLVYIEPFGLNRVLYMQCQYNIIILFARPH